MALYVVSFDVRTHKDESQRDTRDRRTNLSEICDELGDHKTSTTYEIDHSSESPKKLVAVILRKLRVKKTPMLESDLIYAARIRGSDTCFI